MVAELFFDRNNRTVMLEFFRKNYKVVIWLMIATFILTLVPSVFFLAR